MGRNVRESYRPLPPSHTRSGRAELPRQCRRAAPLRHVPLPQGDSISGQLTFPRYTLMWFIHALDAIFELTAVVRKLLSHLIEAAWHVATERGPDGDNLADFELRSEEHTSELQSLRHLV